MKADTSKKLKPSKQKMDSNLRVSGSVFAFLKQLTYPFRKQALAQCTNPNQIVPDKIDALEVAFNWKDSEEGWEYWNAHWNNLIDAGLRRKHLR